MASRSSAAPTVHRFTRDEYYRMAEAGLFRDERVELLDGEIIAMSPQNTPHASTVYRSAHRLEQLIGNRTCIRCQLPIVLDNWSEPEPDIAVCVPDPDDYSRSHPQPEQILFLVEIADASFPYDRGEKTIAYAASGIPELWIVNLPDRRIEVLTDPDPGTQSYQKQQHAFEGEVLSLPGGGSIAVADILPRP
ncbi:MAG TPA: Uma2 family endonuclease [Candidatus Binatia bacterium]|jgi:Uma2 family endonuclease|nr:Uma2 family endonuclease [Candidatus Binatia bacterium]